MAEPQTPRQPTSEVGIWIYQHQHDWEEVGAEQATSGTWHPVFRCKRCQDVIMDLHVDAKAPA